MSGWSARTEPDSPESAARLISPDGPEKTGGRFSPDLIPRERDATFGVPKEGRCGRRDLLQFFYSAARRGPVPRVTIGECSDAKVQLRATQRDAVVRDGR